MIEQSEVPQGGESGLKEDVSPQTKEIYNNLRRQITEKLTPKSILQEGKVVLPDDLKEQIRNLADLTRAESGLTPGERIFASAQFVKIIRGVANAMGMGYDSYFGRYKSDILEGIVVHNSQIGNELLEVFADRIEDTNHDVAYSAVFDFGRSLAAFQSSGSRFKLAPELAERVSSRIRQKAAQGIFNLESDVDTSPAMILAMVEPRP